MKKSILFILLICASLTASIAQQEGMKARERKSPIERSEAFTRRMTKELNLEATQQERVKAINLERFKQLEEIRNTFAADQKTMALKVKEVNNNYFNNLQGVLTAEQFSKFQEMKEEMKEKAMARKHKHKQ